MARPIAKRRRAGSSQRCDFWLFAPRKSEPANCRAGTSCAFGVCGVATTTTTAPARTIAACGALSIRSRSSFGLRHPCSGDRGFWSETDSNPRAPEEEPSRRDCLFDLSSMSLPGGTEGSNPASSSTEPVANSILPGRPQSPGPRGEGEREGNIAAERQCFHMVCLTFASRSRRPRQPVGSGRGGPTSSVVVGVMRLSKCQAAGAR